MQMRLEPASALLAETDTEKLLQNLRSLSNSAESALLRVLDDAESDPLSSASRPASALQSSRPSSRVDCIESEGDSGSPRLLALARPATSISAIESQDDQENQDPQIEHSAAAAAAVGIKSMPRINSEADSSSCSS